VKVPARLYATHFIPGNQVTEAFGDLKVAVWAYPGFAVIGVCADAGLGCVFNTALNFGSAKTHAHRGEIKLFNGFGLGLATLRSIAARH
jgi:hypothetical protein